MKNDRIIIKGLAGEKKLRGTIGINGAKNAALKAMAATVLFDGEVRLENVPENEDIRTMAEILKKLGAKVNQKGHAYAIDASDIASDVDVELAKSMRASVVLTGPLLARFGRVSFPAPGGCVIGARPIDLFLQGYKRLSAKIALDSKKSVYSIRAPRGIPGGEIFFPIQAVGPTETLMMAAVLGKGTIVLKNCAMEPEIANVALWLNSCGARITGIGTPTMTVRGTGGRLLKAKKKYVAIPDRIEAGSYLFLGALCAKDLTITKCRSEHLESVIALLKDAGVPIATAADTIRISGNSMPNSSFKAFNLRTHEYPGFPTDLQAQAAVFLTQASGEVTILETVFEGRFKYAADLIKMGASITEMNPREIIIKGPSKLVQLPDDEELSAHDIRAGFAMVMASLVGKGTFKINNVGSIDRGYEKLEEKLRAIGADIHRISK